MLIIFILFTLYTTGDSLDKSKPVPHADELHKLLSKHLSGFSALQPGSIIDFILNGNGPINPNNGLDTTILDPSGIKKIVEKAWQEHRNQGLDEDAIMWEMFPNDTPEERERIEKLEVDYRRSSKLRNHFGYQQLDVVANMALRMMKQSIYATKERLEATVSVRKKYSHFSSYQIALYTALVHLNILKMDTYWLNMETWYRNWLSHSKRNRKKRSIHFLWFLIYYEKILACNVDVTDAVRRIHTMHTVFMASNPTHS